MDLTYDGDPLFGVIMVGKDTLYIPLMQNNIATYISTALLHMDL